MLQRLTPGMSLNFAIQSSPWFRANVVDDEGRLGGGSSHVLFTICAAGAAL